MKRLLSLDALRGFDMIWIMGLSLVILDFGRLFPGGESWWICTQMHHDSRGQAPESVVVFDRRLVFLRK